MPENGKYINFTDTVGFGDNRPNMTDIESFAQLLIFIDIVINICSVKI